LLIFMRAQNIKTHLRQRLEIKTKVLASVKDFPIKAFSCIFTTTVKLRK
jgi:hypothetical protein